MYSFPFPTASWRLDTDENNRVCAPNLRTISVSFVLFRYFSSFCEVHYYRYLLIVVSHRFCCICFRPCYREEDGTENLNLRLKIHRRQRVRALRGRCQYRCFFRGNVDSTRILVPVPTRYRPRTNKPSLRNTPRNTVQMACDDEYGPTPGSCCNFKAATFHVDAFRTDRTISPTLFGSDVYSLRYLLHRFTPCV